MWLWFRSIIVYSHSIVLYRRTCINDGYTNMYIDTRRLTITCLHFNPPFNAYGRTKANQGQGVQARRTVGTRMTSCLHACEQILALCCGNADGADGYTGRQNSPDMASCRGSGRVGRHKQENGWMCVAGQGGASAP